MKIEIHPNSNIERKFTHLVLTEEKNQVQTVKGRTISNFIEEEKKDGKIVRYFEIKETSGRIILFRWSVACPFVAVFSTGKEGEENLVGFGFICDEIYRNNPVSYDPFWTDSCNAYCIECLRG